MKLLVIVYVLLCAAICGVGYMAFLERKAFQQALAPRVYECGRATLTCNADGYCVAVTR